jgi:hypothetical protein
VGIYLFMNDFSEHFLSSLVGAVFAIFVLWVVLLVTDSTPRQRVMAIRMEAVNLGHARWVINTNKISDAWGPETRFEWITNK